jgi:S-DNA-T family DNA segregation ATPase FtsK/SpoIIIE
VRFLTPTGNKRLNELVGFLCLTLAILIGLALLTYQPNDASFNVSTSPSEDHPAHNWIGPAGAYGSDLIFQLFGFSAFLLPAGLLALGWRWFRSREIGSHAVTLVGYGLLLLSVPSLLALLPVPSVRGAIPAGGFLGTLLASALRSGFNWGAYVIAFAVLTTAIFMTTSFSFAGTHAWATSPKGPIGAVEKLGILQKAQARWHAWREEREQRRMRRRVEESRLSGRKPVAPQSIGKAEVLNEPPKTIRLADGSDIFRGETATEEGEEKEERGSNSKASIFVFNRDAEKPAAKKAGEPKIAKGTPNYKLPSPSLLREGSRSEKLD